MRQRTFLILGGVLMTLLGVARGTGGIILLFQGAAADSNIRARDPAVSVIGVFLLLLALALIVAAVGVFRRQRGFWLLGIVCAVAFVIDGAVNGYVLYGQPGDWGTVVNLLVATMIVASLFAGKGALRGVNPG